MMFLLVLLLCVLLCVADMTGAGLAPLLAGLYHSARDVTCHITRMCTCTSGKSTVRIAGSSSPLLQQQVRVQEICSRGGAIGDVGSYLHNSRGHWTLGVGVRATWQIIAWLRRLMCPRCCFVPRMHAVCPQPTSPLPRCVAAMVAHVLETLTSCSQRAQSHCGTSLLVSHCLPAVTEWGCELGITALCMAVAMLPQFNRLCW